MAYDWIKKAEKIDEKAEEVPKQSVLNFYRREFENCDPKKRVFKLFAKEKDHIAPSDFKPLFRHLLDTHPGLEFLQATPEF